MARRVEGHGMIKFSGGVSRVAAVAASVLFALGAEGTPANKAALERHFGKFLAKGLQSCATCHLPATGKDPESLEDIPHNTFGEALAKAGRQLRREGRKRDIEARL